MGIVVAGRQAGHALSVVVGQVVEKLVLMAHGVREALACAFRGAIDFLGEKDR